jgi:hypothetical protein
MVSTDRLFVHVCLCAFIYVWQVVELVFSWRVGLVPVSHCNAHPCSFSQTHATRPSSLPWWVPLRFCWAFCRMSTIWAKVRAWLYSDRRVLITCSLWVLLRPPRRRHRPALCAFRRWRIGQNLLDAIFKTEYVWQLWRRLAGIFSLTLLFVWFVVIFDAFYRSQVGL